MGVWPLVCSSTSGVGCAYVSGGGCAQLVCSLGCTSTWGWLLGGFPADFVNVILFDLTFDIFSDFVIQLLGGPKIDSPY